ncbi:SAM-dependent methyltransferase [Deinococcus ficus]|nr:SAM-dependent methyltransferase [Deinococcus ficus]
MTVQGQDVTLPQMPPKTYAGLKDVLAYLGVTWDKRRKVHRLTGSEVDLRRKLAHLNAGGRLPPRNPLAFFPTPPEVAQQVAELAHEALGYRAHLGRRVTVLEPSAGEGALLQAVERVWDDPAHLDLHAWELDPGRAAILHVLGYRVTRADFLSCATPADLIVMNPPFSVPGDALAWRTHLIHAVGLCREGGSVIAVLPAVPLLEDRLLAPLLLDREYEVLPLPDGSFKSSGTLCKTVILHVTQTDQSWRRQPTTWHDDPFPNTSTLQVFLTAYTFGDSVWNTLDPGERSRSRFERGLQAIALDLQRQHLPVWLEDVDMAFLYARWLTFSGAAPPPAPARPLLPLFEPGVPAP